ncbi:putative transcription initiation factor IIF subunit beta [Calycina marina]|uniref:Transcription initiation factor IIF subunit beta n=1 Tax=Calycina marina TaxID=1763456 RepID=A0A9P7Z649_9HELO|nr:putative transcription initiation factor IIF subunit beta [Calycina marina]
MVDHIIKPDPEFKLEGSLDDQDIYEDTGDLEFNTDPKFQSVYIAKIPRYVWKAWSQLDDDAEICIGTVRQAIVRDGNQKKEHMQMVLSPEIAQHQRIPKQYDMEVINTNVNNTFLFTEQDLPGYKSKSNQKFDIATANMPSRLTMPSKIEKPKQTYDPNKKFTPYYRKAIPKRTTLAARIKQELNCAPVDNEETRYLMRVMTEEAMRPKHKTVWRPRIEYNDTRFIQPGSIAASSTLSNFIKTAAPTANKRPQVNKAARMPLNELTDALFKAFRTHPYWSMKSLRHELVQPEAYLRETLEGIADLHRSGRFNGLYSLKPEHRGIDYVDNGDIAPDDQDSDTNMDDDDDDDEDE